jgi:flagellar hook-associated protein 2
MSNGVSFAGLSTGLQTDSLISAIMSQSSQPLYKLQNEQSNNSRKTSVLQSIKTAVSSLGIAMNTLNNSQMATQTVSNSDKDGKYASATSYGAVPGAYTLKVGSLATAARSVFGFADQDTTAVGTGTYAVKDTAGLTKTFTIDATNNTLAGFQSALNKAGAAVSATVIDTGKTGQADRYQMVLTSNDTGVGKDGASAFTLAKLPGDATPSALGIASGTLDASGNLASGGTNAQTAGVNASFELNGITLSRPSNVVTDAVLGLTLTLKSGSQTDASTLTVATDKTALKTSVNGVVSAYNSLLKIFKDNSGYGTPTKDASGNTVLGQAGVLANDSSIRGMISQARDAIMTATGGSGTYGSPSEVGLKTGQDGTLSLDSTVFDAALDKDPQSIAKVFQGAGTTLDTLVQRLTAQGDGSIAGIISQVNTQNSFLTMQISSQQARLDRQRVQLQNQYANLESTIGAMQSAGQSLSSM